MLPGHAVPGGGDPGGGLLPRVRAESDHGRDSAAARQSGTAETGH